MNARCIPDSSARVSVFGVLTCTKKIYLSHSFENSNIGKKSCNDTYIPAFSSTLISFFPFNFFSVVPKFGLKQKRPRIPISPYLMS